MILQHEVPFWEETVRVLQIFL